MRIETEERPKRHRGRRGWNRCRDLQRNQLCVTCAKLQITQEEAGTKREALWDLANRICDQLGLKGKAERPEPQG